MRTMLLAGLLAFGVGCATTDTPAEVMTPPGELLERWAESFKSSDIDTMLALYENSDNVIAIESYGRVRRGTSGIRDMYQDAFGEVRVESAEFEDLKVRQSGGVAWATGHLNCVTVFKEDDSRWNLMIQGSFVLQWQAGSWKISVEHFSPREDVERVSRL